MRVLLCSLDSPATLQGGVEWYTHHLARALGDEGHEVKVLAREPHGGPVPEGVTYAWAPLPRGPSSHRYRLRHEPAFWRAVKRAAPWADVVHSQNADALGAVGARPVVATVHTTPLDEWASSRLGGWREWTYQRPVEAYRRAVWRRFARGAAHVWTPGAHVAESLRALGARRVEVLANPVPPFAQLTQAEARRALGLPEGPLALFLGRLAPVKRPHLLIEAALGIPELRVVIAGDGPERAKLEEAAKALAGRVSFRGRVDDKEKELLLHAADVVVLPSEHEGQPLVLLEAMSLGVPVVATRAEWVPPECAPFGLFGEDVAGLIRQALARGRGPPAPVLRYPDVARRISRVYEEVARR